MKFLVVLAVALASAAAASFDEAAAPVVKSDFDINPEGSFQYAYETGNGIYAQASGAVKDVKGEYPAISINGAYKYTSPDGQPIELSYTADEYGYKPVGSHLPVGPEVPELIARSLAYIAAHPPQYEKPIPARNVVASVLG